MCECRADEQDVVELAAERALDLVNLKKLDATHWLVHQGVHINYKPKLIASVKLSGFFLFFFTKKLYAWASSHMLKPLMLLLYSMLGMQLIPFYSILRTYHTILWKEGLLLVIFFGRKLWWWSSCQCLFWGAPLQKEPRGHRQTMTISHLAFCFRVDAQGFLVSRAWVDLA